MQNKDYAALFRALADENRVQIVRMVAANPGITAGELLGSLEITQSTLSHHIGVLRRAALIDAARDGKNFRYSLNQVTCLRLNGFVTKILGDDARTATRIKTLELLKDELDSEGAADDAATIAQAIRVVMAHGPDIVNGL